MAHGVSLLYTLRGITTDVLYVDEAAFVPKALYDTLVFPLFGNSETTVIMTSSPESSDNLYCKLFEKIDPRTGEPVFYTYKLSLMCGDCKQTSHAYKCTHMLRLLPPWKSDGKLEVLRLVQEENEEDFMRESMGDILSDKALVVRSDYIESFFNRLNSEQLTNETFPILVTCDPNGSSDGGTGSEMALCSIGYVNEQFVIVGLDSEKCENYESARNFLRSFVHSLRTIYRTNPIIFCPEKNTGHEAGFLSSQVTDLGVMNIYQFSHSTEPGWHTTWEQKMKYAFTLRFIFEFHLISFHKTFISSHPLEDVKKKLKEQLYRFRVVKSKKRSALQQEKFTISGKVNSSNEIVPGMNDDLVMSLSLNLYIWTLLKKKEIPRFNYSLLT